MLLAAIIRENLDKRSWIGNGQRFAIHLLTFYAVFLSANNNNNIDIGAI